MIINDFAPFVSEISQVQIAKNSKCQGSLTSDISKKINQKDNLQEFNLELFISNLLDAHSTSTNLRNDYIFSYCRHQINKPCQSAKINRTEFVTEIGSLEELKSYIKKGWAIAPCRYKNNYRKKENAERFTIALVDIDNAKMNEKGEKVYDEKLTIEQALSQPFIAKFGAIYTTPSHNPQWNRYRIIFALPVEIDGLAYEELLKILNVLCNNAFDQDALEAGKQFYGNTEAEFYNWENTHSLPYKLIQLARQEAEKVKAEIEQEKAERLEKQKKFTGANSTEIEQALNYISPDCEYGTWIRVGFALYEEFNGSDDGFNLFDNWSAHSPKYDGSEKLYRKWQTFNNSSSQNKCTIATVFQLALENGYQQQKNNEIIDPRYGKVIYSGDEAISHAKAEIKNYSDEEIAEFFTDLTKFDIERIIEEKEINQFQAYLLRSANKHKRGNNLRMPECNPKEIIFNPELLDNLEGISKTIKIIFPKQYRYPNTNVQWSEILKLKLKSLGIKYVIDSRTMGTGKSHDGYNSENTLYVTPDYKNPTVEGWAKTPMIPPRSQYGLFDVNGTIKNDPDLEIIAQAKNPQYPDIQQISPSNCDKKHLFRKLGDLGYDIEGKDNPICSRCEHKKYCGLGTGIQIGGGFRGERKEAISNIITQGNGRCDASQLTPELIKEKFTDFSLIWEEACSESSVKQTPFSQSQLDSIIAQIATFKPENNLLNLSLFKVNNDDFNFWFSLWAIFLNSNFTQEFKNELIDKIHQLKQLINPENGKQKSKDNRYFGLHDEQIKEAIGNIEINEIQYYILAELFELDFEKIMPDFYSSRCDTADKSKEAKRQRAILNETIKQHNQEQLNQNLHNILPNGLKLILWLSGSDDIFGSIHSIKRKEGDKIWQEWSFYACENESRFADLATTSRFNVFLSATANIEQVKGYFGIPDNEPIIIIADDVKLNNIKCIHIQTKGLKSNSYSGSKINQLKKAVEIIKQEYPDEEVSTLCLKKYKKDFDGDGYFFHDDIGSNQFIGHKVMIDIGTPNFNVGGLRIEYNLTYGKNNKFTFEQYYEHKIRELRIQSVGRQRSNHFSDRNFIKYIFSSHDEDLSYLKDLGVEVEVMDFANAFPRLAKGSTNNLMAIAQQLISQGLDAGKLTMQKIADVAGISRQGVHDTFKRYGRCWDEFKELLGKIQQSYQTKNIQEKFCQGNLYKPFKENLTDLENLEKFWQCEDINQAIIFTLEVIKRYSYKFFLENIAYLFSNPDIAKQCLMTLFALRDDRLAELLSVIT